MTGTLKGGVEQNEASITGRAGGPGPVELRVTGEGHPDRGAPGWPRVALLVLLWETRLSLEEELGNTCPIRRPLWPKVTSVFSLQGPRPPSLRPNVHRQEVPAHITLGDL